LPIGAHSNHLSEGLIRECQTLAGDLAAAHRIDRARFEALMATVPNDASGAEGAVIHAIMASAIAHVISVTGIHHHPDVASAFIVWTASSAVSNRWRADFLRLAGTIAPLLDRRCEATMSMRDARVTQALAEIEHRYHDPRLTLQEVANECALSPSRLVRLLQAQTGAAFVEHLHRRRTTEARDLLVATMIPIKEIAATVGYGSSTQLARSFVRRYGQTPIAFRRAAQSQATIRNKR
jgi:AraC-like DNA-binding protein